MSPMYHKRSVLLTEALTESLSPLFKTYLNDSHFRPPVFAKNVRPETILMIHLVSHVYSVQKDLTVTPTEALLVSYVRLIGTKT